jgi:hypothetical protein
MPLTPEQIRARDGKLTASGVGVLMRGEADKIRELWRELTGDPTWVPPDFSDNWPVQLGVATETLHINWLAGKHGEISRRGQVIIHPDHDWAACTLDGWCAGRDCPVEVKHVNGFESRDTVIQRYYPQMTWQMLCCRATQCLFSVIEGAREPIQETIVLDMVYAAELMDRAELFMQHVWNLSEPVALPALAVPVLAVKEYDYTANNLFVSLAGDWLETRLPATKHERTRKRIKEIIPADAMRVFGGGIEVSRDRASRLTIVEKKEGKNAK